jgi:hypothetical protein
MSYDRDKAFCETIGASVTPPFYTAAVKAAVRQGVTLADFVRTAVSNELTRNGVEHPRLPNLRRITFRHLQAHDQDAA